MAGHQRGFHSTPQFDPAVAEVPHFWTGVKGQPSAKTEIYDTPARASMDSRTIAKAIDFIQTRARQETPFFVYVGFTHSHPPWGVHQDFENRSGAGIYADTKIEVDHNVGRILDAIRESGLEENTIVILTGDNGAANNPSPGVVTGEVGGSNGPWHGGLSTAYEGGMRAPAMIRWPGKTTAGMVTDEIVADLDWYPTIAALVGAESRLPTDRPIDGIDQSDFIRGVKKKSNRDHAVTYVGDTIFAVKWRNMKVHFATSEGTHSVIQKYTFPQVFDIKEDPKESFELWGNEGYAHAWVMAPVSKILAGLQGSDASAPWIAGVGDPVALMQETMTGLIRVCYQRGPFLRALSDAATTDERFEKAWNQFLGRFDDAACGRIEGDQEQGLIADFEARPVAFALNRLDVYTLIQAFGQSPRSRPEPVREALARVWISTLYGVESLSRGSSTLVRTRVQGRINR